MSVDLSALYERTKKEGVLDSVDSQSSKVDLESLYEKTKKVGVISDESTPTIIAKDKPVDNIESRMKEPIPQRQNPFMEGAEAMKSAYSSPLNLEGIGKRGVAGLQMLGAPYLAAESALARRAMSAQEGKFLDQKQALTDISQGIVGPRAGLGDVNYRAGLSRPVADAVGAAQSFILQGGGGLIDDGYKFASKGISKGISGIADRLNVLSRESALPSSKEVTKIGRAEGVFNKRAADIEARATTKANSVVDQLKNEKDAVEAQIDHSASIASEAKAVEKANLENEYAKKLLDTHDEIIKTEKAIPYAAQRDANAIKKEIPDWMKKKSAQWNDEIDSALGGADADIFTNKDTVVNELSQLLRSRGVDIVDGVPQSMNGQLGLAEQKIADVINRINNSPQAPSVRSLIKDTAFFGRGNKYGKLMAPDQALLDDARSIVASQAEDILPQIKDIKGWYSDYAQIRNRAFQSLDPFGGRFSRRGTEFIQKLATGKAGPEDYQFLDALESSVGKSAGRESFGLSREANALKQFEASLKNMKEADIAKVNASLDAEISRLQDVLKKESTALENKAGNLVGDIQFTAKKQSSKYLEQANSARMRLAKLRRYKTIAKVASGVVGLGGASAAIYQISK